MDGGAAVYRYDGEGRRMKKTVGSETTYYFYGPGGLLCEFSTSNALSSATAASSTDRTLYRTSDKLGSAVLVMNAGGLVIENNRTLPYGEAWIAENTPSTNDKKFTTYQRDAESGLDYALGRHYRNTSGRFASTDQGRFFLGRPITLNRYLYTSNDPVNKIDPDGMEERATYCDIYFDVDWICRPFGTPDVLAGGDPHSWEFQWGIILITALQQPPIIQIANVSTTNDKAREVQAALRMIRLLLEQDPATAPCRDWLSTNQNVFEAIDFVLGDHPAALGVVTVGVGDFNLTGVNAVAGTGGTNLPPGSMNITMNNSGLFFTGSADDAIRILLHELAHTVGAPEMVQNDFNNPQAQATNNGLMLHCNSVLPSQRPAIPMGGPGGP